MPHLQTVFIVDDNPGMRVALSHFLTAAGLRVETYESAADFQHRFRKDRTGCLLLDIRMPGMTGLELQKWLCDQQVTLPVIVMSGEAAVMEAVEAMKLGSYEFLEKPCPPDLLLARVKDALMHELNTRQERTFRCECRERLSHLTTREREILICVLAGKQSKTIADEIGTSISTVDNHRANILKKLNASSTADLARIAVLGDPSLAFPLSAKPL